VRRLVPKLTWLILALVCPITSLQLLGLGHRRYTASSASQNPNPRVLKAASSGVRKIGS
jgi:hypothetical protein